MTNALLTPLSLDPPGPTVEQLLKSIGLPADFLSSLTRESDWSLVIKLHALFEGVLANLIARALGKSDLHDPISHLDFNHAKAGKVAFARALGLLGRPEVAFLRGLSELRNRLVHDVKNVQFDMKTYTSGMSEAERKKFKTEFGFALLRVSEQPAEYEEYFREDPQLIVYIAAYSCLLDLQYRISGKHRDMLVQALLASSHG